jgi:hypothetical protein
VQDRIRQAVTRLEAQFPAWQIWTVHRAVSRPPTLWCARRWDGEGQVLNAESPDELVEYLEEQAAR